MTTKRKSIVSDAVGGNWIVQGGLILVGLFAATLLIGSVIPLVISILVWSLAGWAAGKLTRRDYGFLHSALLGFGGGLVSFFVFRLLGISLGNIYIISDVLAGAVGALLIIGAQELFGWKRVA